MRRLAVAALFLLGACSVFTDFDQFTGGSPGGSPDGGAAIEGGGPDRVDPAPICAPGQDFALDARNCGRCGHDCLGGGCIASKCQPVLLSNAVKSFHVRVDATHAYLADPAASRLVRIPKRGGAVEEVIAQEIGLYELAVNDQFVFYQTASALKRIAKTGGTPDVVFPLGATGIIGYIAYDANALYWAEGPKLKNANVHRAGFDGANDTVLADQLNGAETIAIDGDDVYYGENGESFVGGNVWHLNLRTGDKKSLVSGPCRRLAIDANDVYWLDYITPNVYAIPRGGGLKKTLAVSVANTTAADIALDDTYVYWAVDSSPGGIFRAPKSGGAVETIDTHPNPTGIAVDDAAIYWTLADTGEVYSRAK